MKVYAVDFDETLYVDKQPNIPLFKFLINAQLKGDKVILNTCRTDKELKNAIMYCKIYGLYFDAVNENLPEQIASLKGSEPRKLLADVFIDDKNVRPDFTLYGDL